LSLSLENLPSLERIQHERTKRNLIGFTKHTKPDYDINWHHENLAELLDKLERKEIKRLMVFMPPRHGKSELVSRRFPAYILGRNPDASIISTSYSASLASAMNRDVQRIIDSTEYSTLFPETNLSGSNVRTVGNYLRNSDVFEIVGHKGSYLSAGVGGGITGRGADYAIIDDPIKNRAEAESKTYRDKVFDWFTSTLYTRLEKDACVLITLTRWHEDDLAGKLLALAQESPDADQWHVINYPAIRLDDKDPTDPRELGEALWEDKYGKDTLNTIKSTIGSYEWSALYEQNPSPSGGSIVQRDWIQYYRILPKMDEIIQSWDFAFDATETSSYVVGQIWGRSGVDKYLIDQVRDRMDFTQSLKAVKNLTAKHPQAKAKFIEKKANGAAIISSVRKHISGMIPVNPNGSKVERVYAITPQFEGGNVYIPDPSIAPWVNDYVEELVSFPNATNDDQTDCTSQALNNMENRKKRSTIKVRSY